MRIPFFQLDVFTDRRFAGNPAAVMLEGACVFYLEGMVTLP